MRIWKRFGKTLKVTRDYIKVSNLGRVRSLDREVKCKTSYSGVSKRKGYILKPGISSNGYLMVALYNNKVQKCRTLHSLIAEAFIPNPNMLPCVNHKNGNRTDNRLENLEWVTYSENNYNAVRKLGRTSTWKGNLVRTILTRNLLYSYQRMGESLLNMRAQKMLRKS